MSRQARAGRRWVRKTFGWHTIDGEIILAREADCGPPASLVVMVRDDHHRVFEFEAPAWWSLDWESGEARPEGLVGFRISILGEVSADVRCSDAEFPSAGTLYVDRVQDVSFTPRWRAGAIALSSPFSSRSVARR